MEAILRPFISASKCLVLFVFGCWLPSASAQQASGIDLGKAEAAFREAKTLSDLDGGHLWGKPLYGPMLFVKASTHEVIANEADPEGTLHRLGSVYTGSLPKEMVLGNTATEWEGKRWTMVLWPLPEYKVPRDRLLMHELFHRIQPSLGLKLASPDNPQLDTMNGRLWLQLEWRALAAAEMATGGAQRIAIEDALAFRRERFKLFSQASASERALDMNEGLAEYTGVRLGSPDPASAKWRTVQQLINPGSNTFVRSFSYTTGPAYGLLLDRFAPGWRSGLTPDSDLAQILEQRGKFSPSQEPTKKALLYGSAALTISEHEREAIAEAERAHYTALLIDGPTLTLPNAGKFNYGFNPNELVPLGAAGTVYPSMQATDDWGALEVEDGALLASNFNQVTVAAPPTTDGYKLQGPGWTLTLKPGWRIAPIASKPGSYTLTH